MTPAKDSLFLLRPDWTDPDWTDQDRTWFCMACAAVEGFLGYYPQLRGRLAIEYLPHPRPRQPLAALLGAAHQNLPTLILAAPFSHPDLRDDDILEANGRLFATDEGPITRYLAARHGVSPPHP